MDLDFVDATVTAVGTGPEAVIPILQALQEHYGYLPEPALERVCATTLIRPAAIAGVSTFFDAFGLEPAGKHRISVCHGTACHVKGAGLVTEALSRHLKLEPGQHTDREGLFTLEKVACLGCCTLAPTVRIGETTYGHVAADAVEQVAASFLASTGSGNRKRAAKLGAQRDGLAEVRVGLGSCCVAGGSAAVYRAMEEAIERADARAFVKRVGCVGMCHQTPLVEVIQPGRERRLYARVTEQDVSTIVQDHFPAPGLFGRFRRFISRNLDSLLTDEAWPGVHQHELDVRDQPVMDFLGRQVRIATEHSGEIDPLDLDEYLARGGFRALHACIDGRSPEETVKAISESGLRGRGGAGFPTGKKWDVMRRAEGERKIVICNGDEGDPGAFMDRLVLESDPQRVVEGLAISAYAVGAEHGIFYIRAEYPQAVRHIREAIGQAEKRGLLGDLKLEVREGAGAFVCGEETAMIASLEGDRGMPRLRPPYPVERGFRGRPTVINNVETLASVPWIVRYHQDCLTFVVGQLAQD